MPRQRRERRSGSLYRRSSDGRWVGSIRAEGRRLTISSRLFCEALRRLDELGVERSEGRAVGKRADYMLAARALGSHTPAEWAEYSRARAGRCEYCGCTCMPTKDHRTPVSRGGSDALENLAVACLRCNLRKNDMTEEEWRVTARPVMHTCKSRRPRGRRMSEERIREIRRTVRRFQMGF